ncbi:hypothetical protein [Streptomyces sp. NBC_00582]|uniref:hypothetical protein n=1 Tax=Streptomyces sp. NBC_00582 TaxID=2975783 RepID=UPI002E804128|nr:hypothetical protein [Streptomyces sp. NBC_00582]WUB63835.1 hypothetical protein OG852_27300 [Streptomyces sp. NBC_00582]
MRLRQEARVLKEKAADADGLLYIVNSTAAYLAAMPHILDETSNVTRAHAFHVRNLPLLKGRRVTVSRLKT